VSEVWEHHEDANKRPTCNADFLVPKSALRHIAGG